MGDCTAALTGITCYHVKGCPPEEPFLAWSIVDRKLVTAPGEDLSPEEFKKSSQGIRDRMEKEEKLFSKWLEKQKKTES